MVLVVFVILNFDGFGDGAYGCLGLGFVHTKEFVLKSFIRGKVRVPQQNPLTILYINSNSGRRCSKICSISRSYLVEINPEFLGDNLIYILMIQVCLSD